MGPEELTSTPNVSSQPRGGVAIGVAGVANKVKETGMQRGLNALTGAVDHIHSEVEYIVQALAIVTREATPDKPSETDRAHGSSQLEEELLKKADSVNLAARTLHELRERIEL